MAAVGFNNRNGSGWLLSLACLTTPSCGSITSMANTWSIRCPSQIVRQIPRKPQKVREITRGIRCIDRVFVSSALATVLAAGSCAASLSLCPFVAECLHVRRLLAPLPRLRYALPCLPLLFVKGRSFVLCTFSFYTVFQFESVSVAISEVVPFLGTLVPFSLYPSIALENRCKTTEKVTKHR